jgi:hypothetical protein
MAAHLFGSGFLSGDGCWHCLRRPDRQCYLGVGCPGPPGAQRGQAASRAGRRAWEPALLASPARPAWPQAPWMVSSVTDSPSPSAAYPIQTGPVSGKSAKAAFWAAGLSSAPAGAALMTPGPVVTAGTSGVGRHPHPALPHDQCPQDGRPFGGVLADAVQDAAHYRAHGVPAGPAGGEVLRGKAHGLEIGWDCAGKPGRAGGWLPNWLPSAVNSGERKRCNLNEWPAQPGC